MILCRVASMIHLRENAAMIHLFRKDRTTGLYSKEYFCQKAEKILQENPGRTYDIICSDIENFKLLNDAFGMQTGNRVLQIIAEVYGVHAKNRQGICSRFYADQFVCMQEHQESYTDEFFEKLTAEVEKNAASATL